MKKVLLIAALLVLVSASAPDQKNPKETFDQVKADKLEGTKAGVSSTPTFFINGRMKRGFKDFDDLKVVIEEKLKEASAK